MKLTNYMNFWKSFETSYNESLKNHGLVQTTTLYNYFHRKRGTSVDHDRKTGTVGTVTSTVVSWCLAFILIVALTAFRGLAQNMDEYKGLTTWNVGWNAFWQTFLSALNTPFYIFSQSGQSDMHRILSYLPLSLFYILFALVFSYVFGILKGMGDVFWKKRPGYRLFHGIAWVWDAVPMFGVVVLLELGTLYGEMYIKGDPVHMIPDRSFVGGDVVPAVILMWPPMMYLSRVIAITLRDELGEQYVLTARSKGVLDKHILRRHIFHNLVQKLLNEVGTVFTIILTSLLALEYLGFRWGAAFDMYVAMGHGQLGEKSLYVSLSPFDTHLVMAYLFIFILLTLLARLVAWGLQKRWRLVHHA